jgi:hypothetical protein
MIARGALTFVETPQPFGGQRAWLVCEGCGHRRWILYLRRAGARCRRCIGLVYERTPQRDRCLRDLQKLRQGTLSLLDPFPPRPKGMWWRTYFALEARYREILAEYGREMADWLAARKAARTAVAKKLAAVRALRRLP